MDQPGGLLDQLDLNGRWALANENSSKRQFFLRGHSADGKVNETFSFSPVFAVFSAEWVEGVDITRLEDHRPLHELFGCLDIVRQYGAIRTLRRCGLRFTALEQVAPELAKKDSEEQVLLQRVLERSTPNVSSVIEEVAGRTTDASVKLVGSHDDKTNYTINYGPFNDVEIPKWFAEISDAWEEPSNADFLCDADFWESDFELTVSPRKWASPLIRRFAKIISRVTDELREKDDGPDRAG